MTEVEISLPRKDFELRIHEKFSGGITGIFGPGGSGKTSLLHAISGLETPASGRIEIEGRTIFDSKRKINIPAHNRNLGYVLQEGRLFPHMSVEKNLMYGWKKRGDNKVGFTEVVDLLNLGHLLKSKPAQISGGERQRTALGRSLLSSPSILLLDEPFSAVDPNLRKQILTFILRIHRRIKIPVLAVSHDLPDLLKLTNSLCVIQSGKSLAHGNYYELLKNNPVSEIFGSDTPVNSVELQVTEVSEDKNQIVVSVSSDKDEAQIKCKKPEAEYKKGQRVRIFNYADDIALSLQRVENITVQNQLQGRVEQVIQRQAAILCIVDVGFKLIVEISAESQQRMNIQPGHNVWCLFKSAAIEMAG